MSGEKRETGINIIGDAPWGTHFCQFYQTKEDLIDILVPFFKAGLENNEFCVWITSEPLSEKEVKEAIGKAVPNLAQYLEEGQLEIAPHTEFYFTDGALDLPRVAIVLSDKLEQALAKGHDGMRVTGNTAWVEKKDWRKFADYEEGINKVIGNYRILSICTYSLDKCGAYEVIDVVGNHQLALVRRGGNWELIESSERKRAEEALAASDGKFRSVIEHSTDGIMLADERGNIIEWNRAEEQITALKRAEVLGRPIWDVQFQLAPEERKTPATYKQIKDAVLQCLGSGQMPWLNHFLDEDMQRLDGTCRTTQSVVFPIKTEQGFRIASISRDITERKQAEEKLKESESFLNSIIEQSPFSTWISDDKGTNIRQNQACRELFGIERDEEVIGKYNMFADEEARRQGFMPLIEEVFSEGKTVNFVIDYDFQKVKHVKVPEATHKILDATIFPIKNASGKVTNAVVQHKDITERKRAGEELRSLLERESKSAREWQELFDASIDVMALISPDFEILRINRAGCESIGKKREELIGKTCYEVVHGLDSPIDGCPCQDLIRTKKAGVGEITQGGRHYIATASPVLDKNDELIAFAHTIKDITKRKRAEEALQASAQQWQTTFNAISDAVCLLDMEGRILQCNTGMTNLLRKPFSEINGRTCWELMHGTSEPIKGCPIVRMRETGHRESLVLPAGDRWLEVFVDPLRDGSGSLIGAVHIISDITERKRAEEREKQLQQQLYLTSRLAAIGELAAGVAHEINNPLTGILGFSQRLLRKSTDQKLSQDLEMIHDEALRAAKVVQNLLTFAHRREPTKEYSDINDIVQKTLELRAYELKTSNIEVVTNLAPSLPKTIVDVQQIKEVFLNIILNAEQAMTEANRGGKLTIKTREITGNIRVSFTDNGPGIAAEHLDKVFDPFFTMREETGGTGLGLSICHGIVVEHGGRIYARSKPGKVATFIVELPVVTEEVDRSKIVEA